MVHFVAFIAALVNIREWIKNAKFDVKNVLLLLAIFITLVCSIKYIGVDDVIRLIEALYALFESSTGSSNAVEVH